MICPTCQHINPSTATVCQNCCTPLRPLRASQQLDRTEAALEVSRYSQAQELLTQADAEMLTIAADDTQKPLLTARAFAVQGRIYYGEGRMELARAELLRSVVPLSALKDQPEAAALLANSLNRLGLIDYYEAQLEQAISYFHQSSDLAISHDLHSIAAKALANAGNVADVQQDTASTIDYYQRSLTQAELSGDPA